MKIYHAVLIFAVYVSGLATTKACDSLFGNSAMLSLDPHKSCKAESPTNDCRKISVTRLSYGQEITPEKSGMDFFDKVGEHFEFDTVVSDYGSRYGQDFFCWRIFDAKASRRCVLSAGPAVVSGYSLSATAPERDSMTVGFVLYFRF